MKCGSVSPSVKLANFYSPSGTRQKFRTTRDRFRLTKRDFKFCDAATLGCAERLGELRPARPRMYRSGGRGHHAAQLNIIHLKPPPDLPYQRHAPRSSGHHRSTAAVVPSPLPMALASKHPVPPRSSGLPASLWDGSARPPSSARSLGTRRQDATRELAWTCKTVTFSALRCIPKRPRWNYGKRHAQR